MGYFLGAGKFGRVGGREAAPDPVGPRRVAPRGFLRAAAALLPFAFAPFAALSPGAAEAQSVSG